MDVMQGTNFILLRADGHAHVPSILGSTRDSIRTYIALRTTRGRHGLCFIGYGINGGSFHDL